MKTGTKISTQTTSTSPTKAWFWRYCGSIVYRYRLLRDPIPRNGVVRIESSCSSLTNSEALVIPDHERPRLVDDIFSRTVEDFVISDFARELAWERVSVKQKAKHLDFARRLYRKMKAIEELGQSSDCLLELYEKETVQLPEE